MSIRFTWNPEEANAITHSGNFHADDIFCMVVLEKLLGDLIVFRSKTTLPEKDQFNTQAIIFDIGYGRYDHHQKTGNGFHTSQDKERDPIPYASLGLLWQEFGMNICDKFTAGNKEKSLHIWNYIEHTLVTGIDAIDNGIYPQIPDEYDSYRMMTVSNVISMLNPTSFEEEDYIIPLKKATAFARLVFDICLNNILYKLNNPDSFQGRKNENHFTAEQIFSYCLLKRIYPNSNDIENLNLWDTGDMKFHPMKKDSEIYDKKPVPTSTFGRIWEIHGKQYCDSILVDNQYPDYIWNFVRTYLVIGIDASANEITPCSKSNFVEYGIFTISDFIKALNPTEYSEEAYYEAKKVALQIADLIFDRVLTKATDRLKARQYVEKKILESNKIIPPYRRKLTDSSKHILVFDRHIHWQDWVSKSPLAKNIWFVVSPSNKGGYVVQPVPCKYNENGYRKGFPKKWHGLNGDALKRITKVSTATFVHPKNGFIGGAEDLDGAIKLAEKAFANTECARKNIPF